MPPISNLIAVRSLSLPERLLIMKDKPEAFTPDPERAHRLRAAWRDKLGLTTDATLDRQLASLDMTDAEFDRVVGDLDPDGIDLSDHADWLEVLNDVLALPIDDEPGHLPERSYLSREDETPKPFEHAFVTWVDVATERLGRRLGDAFAALPTQVVRREQRTLIENLAQLSRDALIHELRLRKMEIYSGNDLALGFLTATPPNTAYAATIHAISGPGSDDWWTRYAALARLLAVRCNAWVRSLAEIVEHLERDFDSIVSGFFDGLDPGPVEKISREVADSHNGGRSVAIVTFRSGAKIVYKPRNMDIDERFVDIVDAVNESLDVDLRIRVPKSWSRGRYGWMEFAKGEPCEDDGMVRRYHRRMGSLLAIVHALQGNDFHLENVMASGEFPVPIDLETVSVPEPKNAHRALGLVDPAGEAAEHSVLRTLLLPSVIVNPGITPMNLGAMEVEEKQLDGSRVFYRLANPNTDFQRWTRVEGTDPEIAEGRIAHVERRDGTPIDTNAMIPEIVEGYRLAYRSILSRREDLMDPEGPINAIGSSLVRVLNRATSVYYRLLQESCRREHLASGVDRWVHLERLSIVTAQEPTADEGRAVIDSMNDLGRAVITAEQASLMDGDIAYLVARGDSTDYLSIDPESCEPRIIPGAELRKSAVDAARSQMERMDHADLEFQERLMDSSYMAAYQTLNDMLHGSHERDVSPEEDAAEGPDISDDQLRDRVLQSLEWLHQERIPSGRFINWIEAVLNPETETMNPGALDLGTYSGRGGIVQMLELAYRALGDRRWLEMGATATELEIRSLEMGLDDAIGLGMPPSGFSYRGGAMTSLWVLGRHEGYGRHRDAARRVMLEVSERAIENDRSYDVISGSAGHILLTISMMKEDPIPGAIDVVGRLADHLMRSRVDIDGPGWRLNPNNIPVCGFGHGRSGTALALLEAGRILDRKDLRIAAIEVFEAEHRLRGQLPSEGWPDLRNLRDSDPRPSPTGGPFWCSGLEGIALSRAAALQIEDHPVLRDDLEFCLAGLRESNLSRRHHLCCGVAGRLEVDVALQEMCDTSPFLDEAAHRRILHRSLDPTKLRSHGLTGVSLFQGIGGPIWRALGQISGERSGILLARV